MKESSPWKTVRKGETSKGTESQAVLFGHRNSAGEGEVDADLCL
jgi:hypothetical protein